MMAAHSIAASGYPLGELLAGFAVVAPGLERYVIALTEDSRAVAPGALYVARRGRAVDGARFIDAAIAAGAVAVIREVGEGVAAAELRGGVPVIAVSGLQQRIGLIAARFYGDPSRDLFTVAVTGTNGKSSVTHFIAQALTAAGRPCGLIGTLGYGIYGKLREGSHTTPQALELQGLLAGLRDDGAAAVALEASSHGLVLGRMMGTGIDVAIFTNLSRDHLDFHGDMASYAAAKRRLFTAFAPRHAVINGDDPFGRELLGALPAGVEAIVYTLEAAAPLAGRTLRGRDLTLGDRGLAMTVEWQGAAAHLATSLLGHFNAANLLAALGALLAAGLSLEEGCAHLAAARPPAGRMERLGGDVHGSTNAAGAGKPESGRPIVVVDYAHTPDALEQVLIALRGHCRGRLTCLFGCGGERDHGKRPLMGAVAERLADRVVVTDDNPRHEPGDTIVAEILAGMARPEQVTVERDRARAIAAAVAEATAGDLVLIAGKGHERYQSMGDDKRSFDDAAEARRALGMAGV